MDHGFIEALRASGPHPSLGAHADTYAPIIGSWSGELSRYQDGKSVASATVEAHFGWKRPTSPSAATPGWAGSRNATSLLT